MKTIRRIGLLAGLAGVALSAPPAANAATEIGSTFDPGTSFCGNMLLQSASPPADSYAAPSAGVLTSWSYQASEGPVQIKLKVGRAAGANSFLIVGESAVQTAAANSTNTFPTRISVQAGDVIGITPVTNGLPCVRMMAGYSYSAYVMGDDVPPGTTATFNPPVANVQLDVSARLEPDGDRDGFGDETQDRCLGVPGPVDGCPDNAFTLGAITRNKKKGTATIAVSVPSEGALAASGNGVTATLLGPPNRLLIKARGKKRHKLEENGKVKVSVAITYTPTGGNPNTQAVTVKLIKR
jgi:hypothetical protein